MSDGPPQLIPIKQQPHDQIVHACRFGKTDRPAYPPLEPRAPVDVLALDLLRIGLPYGVLRSSKRPLVSLPAIGALARDAQGLQPRLELHADVSLPSAEDIRQALARVGSKRVPQPGRMGCALHVAPHLVAC